MSNNSSLAFRMIMSNRARVGTDSRVGSCDGRVCYASIACARCRHARDDRRGLALYGYA